LCHETGKAAHSEYISPFHLSDFVGFQSSLENTHKGHIVRLLLDDQGINSFQLQGSSPPNLLTLDPCPWTPLGALSPDPHYRLALRARHILEFHHLLYSTFTTGSLYIGPLIATRTNVSGKQRKQQRDVAGKSRPSPQKKPWWHRINIRGRRRSASGAFRSIQGLLAATCYSHLWPLSDDYTRLSPAHIEHLQLLLEVILVQSVAVSLHASAYLQKTHILYRSARAVCLSVRARPPARQTHNGLWPPDASCVSVTLMYCAQTTESIIMRSSPDCNPAILVSPYQTWTQ